MNYDRILIRSTLLLVGAFAPFISNGAEKEVTDSVAASVEFTHLMSDKLWVLLAAALVFFMQAGFKAFEVGVVRKVHGNAIGIKNLIDWITVTVTFFAVGFGSMFGHSAGGFIGTDLYFMEGVEHGGSPLGIVFVLFQMAFAGTALTIVSGAMSERTGFVSYLTSSILIGILIYPVFGHWAWGNLFYTDNEAWLADLGFMDFAGSTVVHSVGAWIALVGVIIVGPRIGRFTKTGRVKEFEANSFAYSVLGVFILWFGWWGFNGGSTLTLDDSVGGIILNTNLSAAAGGLAAFYHAFLFQRKRDIYSKLMGGILGGLVAITACCNVVDYNYALLIGAIAGVVHNYSYEMLLKLKIDDPVGAIPVHGFCGVWGTMAVGFFGRADQLMLDRPQQILVQLLGVLVCFAFTVIVSYILFTILKYTIGLRVSPMEEKFGIKFGNNVEEYLEDEYHKHEKDNVIDANTLVSYMEKNSDNIEK